MSPLVFLALFVGAIVVAVVLLRGESQPTASLAAIPAGHPVPVVAEPTRPTSESRFPVAGDTPSQAVTAPASSSPPEASSARCPIFEANPFSPSRWPVSSDWHKGADGYAQGEREQQASRAPMAVYFYTDWCGYCKQLDAELLSNFEVERHLRSRIVKVRVNPESGPPEKALAERFGVKGYPALFLVTQGTIPERRLGIYKRDSDTVLKSPQEFIDTIEKEVSRRAHAKLKEGRERRQAGDLSGSIALLDESIDLAPDEPEAYFERGTSHHENGSADRGLEDFRRALELRPRYAEVYEYLDDQLGRQQRWDEMIACWTKFLEQAPGSSTGYLRRGRNHERRGDPARARADAAKACSLGEAQACELARQLAAGLP